MLVLVTRDIEKTLLDLPKGQTKSKSIIGTLSKSGWH